MRITEITRRDVIDFLSGPGAGFLPGRLAYSDFTRLYLQTMHGEDLSPTHETTVNNVWRHMEANDDYTVSEWLVGALGLIAAPDRDFELFLEACVHPVAMPDKARAAELVAALNPLLQGDGLSLVAKGELSGRPLYKVRWGVTPGDGGRYDVALSFAGENRAYAEQVARVLRDAGARVFYDKWETPDLWGKDLAEYLPGVYGGQARFCVMFVSQHYAEKAWPTRERRAAFERAIQEKTEYILPVQIDGTAVPGLSSTIHYLSATQYSARQVGELAIEKLRRAGVQLPPRD
jgi:hypothetical protein